MDVSQPTSTMRSRVLTTGISNAPIGLVTPSLNRNFRKLGNIHPMSIVYALQPRLRHRLTLGGFTFPRKPWAYGGQDSHLSYRYSFRHNRLYEPTTLLTVRLVSPIQRSPTNLLKIPRLRLYTYSRSLSALHCSTSKLLRTF